MLSKKFLLGTILTAAVCLTACADRGSEVTEISAGTVTAAEAAETTSAETTTAAADITENAAGDIAVSREYEFDLDEFLKSDTYDRYALRDELEFLDDEQYDTYIKALIFIDYLGNCSVPSTGSQSTYFIDENGEICESYDCNDQDTGHTHYRYISTYKSFYEYLLTVFTQDAADRIVFDKLFLKRGGELYFKMQDGGGLVYFDDSKYNIIEENDSETVFEYTAYKSINNEDWTCTRRTKLIYTDNGWRSEFFENLYIEKEALF